MLLKGALVGSLDPPRVERADLRIAGERIAARAPDLAAAAGEEVVGLADALVLPGFVNAHTHLYSALARGMPGARRSPRSFLEILQRVWWRLDRALDAETVGLSALVGAMDAARSGTTVVFDHHSSPSFIEGSLAAVREALEAVGLRSVLCYETTDRNGPGALEAALVENRAGLAGGGTSLTRAMVGAHASFTLSAASLGRLAELVRATSASLHVHVAEDRSDVEDCQHKYGIGIVERLRREGLLRPRTLLAHGVHLGESELLEAQAAGAWIVHNPRSNMHNGVGHAPTHAFKRAALGSDGLDEDMFAEARCAFLRMRDAGRQDASAAVLEMLQGGLRLASSFFGMPFGTLGPGSPADLVVLDCRTPTPLTADNLVGHLLFGLDRSHVRSTMVAGRFVLRDRRISTVDEFSVLARAGSVAPALWERMAC